MGRRVYWKCNFYNKFEFNRIPGDLHLYLFFIVCFFSKKIMLGKVEGSRKTKYKVG